MNSTSRMLLAVFVLVSTTHFYSPPQAKGQLGGNLNFGGKKKETAAVAPTSVKRVNTKSRTGIGNSALGAGPLASFVPVLDKLKIETLVSSDQPKDLNGGDVLALEAKQAIRSGRVGLAIDLVHGHMVVDHETAASYLGSARYSPLLERPVWQVKVGVSTTVRGDAENAVSPIRETGSPNTANASNSPSRRTPAASSDVKMSMGLRTGKNLGEKSTNNAPKTNGSSVTQHGNLKPISPNRNIEDTLGLIGTIAIEQFSQRYNRGDYGIVLLDDINPSGSNFGGAGTNSEVSTFVQEIPAPLVMLSPGLVYLGDGQLAVLRKTARVHNIDVLLHFDVSVKTTNDDSVKNITRCRLIDVGSGKVLGISKVIDSLELEQLIAAKRNSPRGYVEDQLANLFDIVDRELKVTPLPLPKLTAEVKQRITEIFSVPSAKSLVTLAEVRLYQHLKLLNDAETEVLFQIAGGADGLTMLYGHQDDKIATVHNWASQSQHAAR